MTACATGTNSIGEAFKIIQRGDADAMITGGTEAPITDMAVQDLALAVHYQQIMTERLLADLSKKGAMVLSWVKVQAFCLLNH